MASLGMHFGKRCLGDGAVFESCLSRTVQSRQRCCWRNVTPQEELTYQTEEQLREPGTGS